MPALESYPVFYLTLGDARSHRSKHRNSRSDQDWTSTRCRCLRQSLSGIRVERVSFNAAGLSDHFLGPHGHVYSVAKIGSGCLTSATSHIYPAHVQDITLAGRLISMHMPAGWHVYCAPRQLAHARWSTHQHALAC